MLWPLRKLRCNVYLIRPPPLTYTHYGTLKCVCYGMLFTYSYLIYHKASPTPKV